MTYQVLARKWRPGNFSDMVGQGHVLRTLTHALDNERLHHAYLFTGTRGVGKTTLARIVARCLNCETGVSASPCGKCDACNEIAEGRFIDLIEVDAASRTKVEDTRELLENVQYAPSRGRFKIYLIDEVHMLSNHSFNALLKTLEEPPPHVKFLLATTDPHKLPVTVLSRCLQFNLKNLTPQLISDYLKSVLIKENIDFEEPALWQIAAAASGSMRDALTLLDQAISFSEGSVTAAAVTAMLGTPDQALIFEILDCLARLDAEKLLQSVRIAADSAPDFAQLLDSLLVVMHRIAIAQVIPAAVDNSYGDHQRVLEFAQRITAEDLQLYYQICLKGKGELNLAGDQQAMVEMLLIRMLAFTMRYAETTDQRPATEGQPDVSASDRSEVSPGKEKKKNFVVEDNAEAEVHSVATEKLPDPESVSIINSQQENSQGTEAVPGVDNEFQTPFRESEDSVSTEEPTFDEIGSLSQLNQESWISLCSQLAVPGITGNVLANSVFQSASGDNLSLILDKKQSAIYSDDHRLRIEELISQYFNRQIALQIVIAETNAESMATRSRRLRKEAMEALENRFRQDQKVKDLITNFSGEILVNTISPIEQ